MQTYHYLIFYKWLSVSIAFDGEKSTVVLIRAGWLLQTDFLLNYSRSCGGSHQISQLSILLDPQMCFKISSTFTNVSEWWCPLVIQYKIVQEPIVSPQAHKIINIWTQALGNSLRSTESKANTWHGDILSAFFFVELVGFCASCYADNPDPCLLEHGDRILPVSLSTWVLFL